MVKMMAGFLYSRATREATMPFTPSCQPSPATMMMGASQSVGSSASAALTCSNRRASAVRLRAFTSSRAAACFCASTTSSLMSKSNASVASPMRPAAFIRGMRENESFVAVMEGRSALHTAASAAMPGRGALRIRSRPAATMARFSLVRGMMSLTVPSAAKSTNSRHTSGRPKRRPSMATSFRATPAPARSKEGQVRSSLLSATGTPHGTWAPASWWSVMHTSMPASRMAATSASQAMPQSTVTIKSGENASMPRRTAASDSA